MAGTARLQSPLIHACASGRHARPMENNAINVQARRTELAHGITHHGARLSMGRRNNCHLGREWVTICVVLLWRCTYWWCLTGGAVHLTGRVVLLHRDGHRVRFLLQHCGGSFFSFFDRPESRITPGSRITRTYAGPSTRKHKHARRKRLISRTDLWTTVPGCALGSRCRRGRPYC